jgi:hypothetical protein
MVEAIDADQSLPHIMVPQALSMVAAAWNTVSPDTIRKCWALTEVKGKGKEKEKEKETDETGELRHGMEKVIAHLKVKGASVENFLAVDSEMETSEEKTEEQIAKEIAARMKGKEVENEKEEEGEKETEKEPQLKEAIDAIFNLVNYCDFSGEFTPEEKATLEKIRMKLTKEYQQKKKQTLVSDFFSQ